MWHAQRKVLILNLDKLYDFLCYTYILFLYNCTDNHWEAKQKFTSFYLYILESIVILMFSNIRGVISEQKRLYVGRRRDSHSWNDGSGEYSWKIMPLNEAGIGRIGNRNRTEPVTDEQRALCKARMTPTSSSQAQGAR